MLNNYAFIHKKNLTNLTDSYLNHIYYNCIMNKRVFNTYIGVLLLLLLNFNLSKASSRYQSSITLNDDLPSNNIYQIFCDSRNIVWIATDAGFFEFDGEKIIVRKELQDLYGEKILSACEDHKGDIWLVAANTGLCYYDGYTIKIYKPEELGLKQDVQTVYFDQQENKLIIGTTEGAYKVSIQNKEKLKLISLKADEPVNITAFVQNNNKVFAISNESEKIFDCDITTNTLNLLERDEYLPNIEFNQFNSSQLLNDRALKKEAFKIRNHHNDEIDCEVIQIKHVQNEAFYLVRYFIAGIEYRKVLRVFDQQVEDFSKSNHIDDVFVQSIYVDKDESNIWLGTKNRGILHFQNSIFQYFNASYFHLDDLSITDIETDDKGFVYIATDNEIIYFKEDQVQKRISTSKLCASIKGYKSAVCEKKIQIFDILNDGKSKLWLATNLGFYTLNLRNGSIKYLGISPAHKFEFTNKGELCCIWNNEFFVFKGKDYEQRLFTYKFSETTKIDVNRISTDKSAVWFSNKLGGLYRYEAGKIEQFNKENSNIHNIINDLILLPDGHLIAGGNNGSIYKLKYENKTLHILDIINNDQELFNSSIRGFQYLNGNLWCGTNKGVYRFDYKAWGSDSTINYRFWDHQKGYYDRSAKGAIVDINHNIWVPTNTQLLKVTNSLIDIADGRSYSLNLKNIEIHNKNWTRDPSKICHWTKKIIGPLELLHKENDLTFIYGFQNSLNLGKKIYRYQLMGFDSEWSKWSEDTKAVYSHLPSGEYTLNIQGRHLNKANTVPFSIKVTIESPWWRKPWFYALSFSIIVTLIIAGMRIYTRRIRKQEEERNKINTSIIGLKMKTLQNQLDPHFIFNALNSIQGYILEEEIENALDYLSDFSTVLRKNINNADKDYIILADEITYLKHYAKLEQMRFMDRFVFKIVLSKDINPYNYSIPPMLIQPFIESAIKFGISACNCDGLILINFDLEDNNYIRCTIEDNGIGRSKSKEFDAESRKSSHEKTMKIIQERISLLNKMNNNTLKYDYKVFDLYDEAQNPVGTKIEIGLPFRKVSQ